MKKHLAILWIFLFVAALSMGCTSSGEPEQHVIWRPSAQTQGETQPSEPSAVPAASLQEAPPDEPQFQEDDLEYAIFPMDYLHITQTSGEGTHLNNRAVDLAGADTGIDDFYAPFTLRIVRIQKGYNIVWAESAAPVHLANGDVSYISMLLEHSNHIDGLYIGQQIPQGEVFYDEGTAGNASGNHVHCEFGLGRFVDEGSFHTDDGRVACNNGIAANEVLFLTQSTQIVDEGGFTWQQLPLSTEEIVSTGKHCLGDHHVPTALETLQEPTCTSDGACRYTCQICGLSVTQPIPATGHTPTEQETIAPNAAGVGAVRYKCDVCGVQWLELQWDDAPVSNFSDVSDNPYIAYAAQQSLMRAFEGDRFLPDGYVTRLELLRTLYNLGGSAGYSCDYDDLEPSDEEYPIAAWGSAMGLIQACSQNRFLGDAPITRIDAITMVTGFLGQTDLVSADSQRDWAVEAGLFHQTDNLSCALTRAECAKLLTLMQLLPTISK